MFDRLEPYPEHDFRGRSLFADDLCIPQGMHVLSVLPRLTHLNLGP